MTRLRMLVLATAVLSVAGAAPAQAPESSQANTIQVAAVGKYLADPDTAVVRLEISGRNPNLKLAYAAAGDQAEQVRGLLAQQGFAPAAARWSSYTVAPEMDYKTHKVTDYTVSAAVQLRLDDFAKIAPLLEAFGAVGINALRGVSFELKDTAAAKAAAIADGYRRAHDEAVALARAAGRQLEGLSFATVDVSVPVIEPEARAMELSASLAPTAGFSPHQIAVTARILAVYRISP